MGKDKASAPAKSDRALQRLQRRLAESHKLEDKRRRQLEAAQERSLAITVRMAELAQPQTAEAETVVIAAAFATPASVVVEQPAPVNGTTPAENGSGPRPQRRPRKPASPSAN